MFRRGAVVGVIACSGAIAVAVPTALAAKPKTVTLGQLFTPTDTACTGPGTALQTGVASGRPYTVPKKGVITSWSWEDAAATVSGLSLRVGRSVGGGMYKIVGAAKAGTQKAHKVNTYKTHIPVKAGDVIGFAISTTGPNGPCASMTTSPLNTVVTAQTVVPPGSSAPFTSVPKIKLPVSVRLQETR